MSVVISAPPGDVAVMAMWRLLSLTLAPASSDSLELASALADGLAESSDPPEAIEPLRRALAGASPEAVAAAQARLFGGGVEVAPYEGSYEDDPFRQARQLSDVAGFYRAFGAEAGGPAYERPDHAGCELEFLAFLCARRLAAADVGRLTEAELCDEVEDAFLRDHAGRWLPTFFRALERAATDALHVSLGRCGAAAVSRELAKRGIVPGPVGLRGRRLAVEADELECGSGP